MFRLATFLEKVAQKAAFRDSHIPPGTTASGMANKDRAQGQESISLMRFDESKLSLYY